MLTNAALLALATAAQAVYAAADSTCLCFHYHVSPTFKPGVPFITFTELDETDELLGGGPLGLRGNANGQPDLILAKYRLNGHNTDAAADNATALALTEQMRADKLIFRGIFTTLANTNLGGLVLEAGKRLHIVSPRGGPYDVASPVRLQLSWECTITCRASLK
jgi:hypothetical protein